MKDVLTFVMSLTVAAAILSVKASVVYDCSTWPAGTIQTSVIVDCADGALPSGPKSVPQDLWTGPKYLVDVSRNGLTGSLNLISPANSLRSINVASNSIDGLLPTVLPIQLRDLDLSDNFFVGPLPSSWNTSISLRTVDFSGNTHLNGTIPDAWSTLTKLEVLDLRGTGVGGVIPASLGALSRLSSLQVDGCNFTECVPLGIPFPFPSMQVTGYILKQCTAAPSKSPSKTPTHSQPTRSPSKTPSRTPSLSPSRRTRTPTTEEEIETSSPTMGDIAGSTAALGIGIGVGVTAVVIFGLGVLLYVFKRGGSSGKPNSASQQSMRKSDKQLAPALALDKEPPLPLNPKPARSAPLPSGPRPGKTFVPGSGWTQDKAKSGPVHEPVPPPARPPGPPT